MIITKTPFRVSFVGGGSDLKEFYQHFPGAVLSTTIDKFVYISSHYFFDEDKVRVKYSHTETVSDVNELKHPIVKEILKKFKVKGALEVSSNADIPASTGLGSSSSFTVGMLHTLYREFRMPVSKQQLAEEACDIEIDTLKEPIGKQDQYAAAFGGLNVIRFNPPGMAVMVEPLQLEDEVFKTLENNLFMFYIGDQRKASSILAEQKENVQSKKKSDILKKMVDLVWKARDVLSRGDLNTFGEILHKNWVLKQELASKITNPKIDNLYYRAIASGAVGGKLLGAGGGGFLLFYCDKKNHKKLESEMSFLRRLEFKFEKEGSKLIYEDEKK